MVYGCGCLFKMVWTPLALPKFSPYQNSVFLLYRKLYDTEIIVDCRILNCQLPGVRGFFLCISKESDKMAKRAEEEQANDLGPGDERKKEKEERREERRRTHIHTPQHIKHQNSWGFTKSLTSARLPPDLVRQFANRHRSHRPSPVAQRDSLAPVIFFFFFF